MRRKILHLCSVILFPALCYSQEYVYAYYSNNMIVPVQVENADSISKLSPSTKVQDGNFYVYYADGSNSSVTQNNLDSISSISKCVLSVSPVQKEVAATGEQFWVQVMSNTGWNVSSNKDWSVVSKTVGDGNDNIKITVAANTTMSGDNATISFVTVDNLHTATVSVNRLPSDHETVTDACGNTYKVVKIGSQYWMAENMRCNKYDSESDRPNEIIETCKNLINVTREPYYMKYDNEEDNKLYGYVYNWPATVGLASIDDYSSDFSGQGICPNGWHVPTYQEVLNLRTYIERTCGYGIETAAKYLRSDNGWYYGSGECWQGLDTFGFNVLPCGWAVNYSTGGWGISKSTTIARFWTQTRVYNSDNKYAHDFYFRCMDDIIHFHKDASYEPSVPTCETSITSGFSIRCIKN